MLASSKAFSGIAVKDIAQSKYFFGEVLGLQVDEGDMGMLVLRPTGGRPILLYPKPDHVPATYLRQEARFGAQLLLDAGAVCVLDHERGVPAVRSWNETAG